MKALWAQRYKADQKGLLKEDREIPEGQDGACPAEDSKAGDSRRCEMQMFGGWRMMDRLLFHEAAPILPL